MGAMIKADEMGETRRGMKRKVSRQSQFLRSALVHAVSAFICALVCSYSYWFPWLFCFINHFVWIYLPSVWPLVFGPKCMFVVANAIVLAVVGDWRQTCAKSKNTHQDMYEEYVRRSRGPRRVLVYKKVERKEENSVRKIHAKALEIEKEIVENKEEIAEEFHEDILETEVTNPEETNEDLIEEASASNSKEMEAEAEDSNNSAEKTTASPDEDIKKVKETGSADESQNEDIKKVEETGSNEDELNKRVEDFIARVNKRRWDEANNWLICSA